MKSNTKYTALEILTAAKIVDAGTVFGKMRVRIAGIAGIVTPDHLIKIGPAIKVIDIIVGIKKYEVPVEGVEENFVVTEAAKKVIEAKGKKINEAINARIEAEKAKAEAVKPTIEKAEAPAVAPAV